MNLTKTLAITATTIGLTTISNSVYAAIIGVDFGPGGSSTPINWNLVTGAGTTTNLIDETGVTTGVDVNVSSPGPVTPFGAAVLGATIPVHSNPLNNIGGSIFDSSFSGNQLTITFANLVPNQTYLYWLFGLRDSSISNLDQNVLVNGVSFNQSAIPAGSPGKLLVNDQIGSNAQNLQSYGIPITTNALGQIITTITPNTDIFGVAGIAIEPQDIPPTPEPGSVLALFGLGLGALASRGKKQDLV